MVNERNENEEEQKYENQDSLWCALLPPPQFKSYFAFLIVKLTIF